jgi:hypothetical protein
MIQKKLNEFITRDKFSNEAWEMRGLNSSGPEMSEYLNQYFNNIANKLVNIESNNTNHYKETLLEGINGIDSVQFDTEEREFIIDTFLALSEITDTNLKKELTVWMYGVDISEMLASNPVEEILRTVTVNCEKCKSDLITEIIEEQSGIPDFAYLVAKCNTCGAFSLIEIGPNVKNFKMKNYSIKEQLPKTKFTKHEANVRLEELRTQK